MHTIASGNELICFLLKRLPRDGPEGPVADTEQEPDGQRQMPCGEGGRKKPGTEPCRNWGKDYGGNGKRKHNRGRGAGGRPLYAGQTEKMQLLLFLERQKKGLRTGNMFLSYPGGNGAGRGRRAARGMPGMPVWTAFPMHRVLHGKDAA